MTPKQINIAIAEACGWVHDEYGWSSDAVFGKLKPPDYLHDLNAMHEAENWYFAQCKTVDEKSLWLDMLAVVCGWEAATSLIEAKFISDINCSRATAAQRAEAFLRTIGKREVK